VEKLIKTNGTFASLIKAYDKKVGINKNLLEKEIKSLWNEELAKMIITNRQKVHNYLLGQMRKKFPDYPPRVVISIIINFLNDK
jgi:hypothetical protein